MLLHGATSHPQLRTAATASQERPPQSTLQTCRQEAEAGSCRPRVPNRHSCVSSLAPYGPGAAPCSCSKMARSIRSTSLCTTFPVHRLHNLRPQEECEACRLSHLLRTESSSRQACLMSRALGQKALCKLQFLKRRHLFIVSPRILLVPRLQSCAR